MAMASCPMGHSCSWMIIIEERHVGSAALEGRVLRHAWKCHGARRDGRFFVPLRVAGRGFGILLVLSPRCPLLFLLAVGVVSGSCAWNAGDFCSRVWRVRGEAAGCPWDAGRKRFVLASNGGVAPRTTLCYMG